jgi:hypothetical protein
MAAEDVLREHRFHSGLQAVKRLAHVDRLDRDEHTGRRRRAQHRPPRSSVRSAAGASGARRRTVTPARVSISTAHPVARVGDVIGTGIFVKLTGPTATARRRARTSHHWSVESGRPVCSQKAR